MQIKIGFLLIILLSFISTKSVASPQGLYFGAGLTSSHSDRSTPAAYDANALVAKGNTEVYTDSDDSSGGMVFYLGYRWDEHWAINLDVDGGRVTNKARYKSSSLANYDTMLQLSWTNVRPEINYALALSDEIEVYGLLGFNIALSDVRSDAYITRLSGDDSYNDKVRTWSVKPSYGVGIRWEFAQSWHLQSEVTQYEVNFIVDDEHYDTTQTTFSLGVTYFWD